ncbi:hypothetical protein [Ekhidna sp.]|uniref:hypothetical protein n=1 Tax=Ekhidna sp. TaxID=2608089 RepID=UPI003C7D2495
MNNINKKIEGLESQLGKNLEIDWTDSITRILNETCINNALLLGLTKRLIEKDPLVTDVEKEVEEEIEEAEERAEKMYVEILSDLINKTEKRRNNGN